MTMGSELDGEKNEQLVDEIFAARAAPSIASMSEGFLDHEAGVEYLRRSADDTISMLFKSCAVPPVSCPSASIFCDWRAALRALQLRPCFMALGDVAHHIRETDEMAFPRRGWHRSPRR